MINYILNWWRAYKERGRLADIERLRQAFRIKEKNGALWIMHGDTAVDMLPAFASSEEIVRMLEETRCCAVEYAFGVYYNEAHTHSKHLRKIADALVEEKIVEEDEDKYYYNF